MAFKKIFGNKKYKNVLISFLNSILDFKDAQLIKEVSIISPYPMSQIAIAELLDSVLDVKVVNQKEQEFIVKIQIEKNYFFPKRSLYYTAKSYINQIENTESYRGLKKFTL